MKCGPRPGRWWQVAVLGAAAALAGCASQPQIDTLANLQRAYAGTVHQYKAYLVDASLADAQGYHGSADYFRILARRELTRAQEQARQIRELGGQPRAGTRPAVKTGAS